MFGFMNERTDIGNYMKAIDSMLPAFTIGGTLPSYLTKMYLVSTILFSPSVRGALGAVKHIENASEAAVERRGDARSVKLDPGQGETAVEIGGPSHIHAAGFSG